MPMIGKMKLLGAYAAVAVLVSGTALFTGVNLHADENLVGTKPATNNTSLQDQVDVSLVVKPLKWAVGKDISFKVTVTNNSGKDLKIADWSKIGSIIIKDSNGKEIPFLFAGSDKSIPAADSDFAIIKKGESRTFERSRTSGTMATPPSFSLNKTSPDKGKYIFQYRNTTGDCVGYGLNPGKYQVQVAVTMDGGSACSNTVEVIDGGEKVVAPMDEN